MEKVFKVMIGAIFAVILIGALVMLFAQPEPTVNPDNSVSDVVQEQVDTSNNVESVNPTDSQNNATALSSSNSTGSNYDTNGVSGGQLENNYQEGQGTYYQINYKDGNFRQYDTKTGELIGSSFDEDQEKLGVVNGDLQ